MNRLSTSSVRGVVICCINDVGLITNMFLYWNPDAMTFGEEK
ncbi:hypothetical protein [Mycobacterium lepromatosis]|nr:hypothetical protein [Mycobacterium lepromatosis]